MAYEIISQNNTTTTLSDGTNTITVPARVTLATSTSYTISEVNNNTATLEGSDGSVIRDVPCVVVLAGEGGGGGSDQHNLGYYATQAALEEAHPTAEAGDYAIVGATDTVWIWDEDESAWVDSDQKGQVTSVNGQTGAVTLTIPAAQVNSDWNASSGVAEILNKPTLATVATSGAYSDLTGTPTIPAAIQVSTMPTAAAGELDKIYQFIGTTDANYTNGYFYKCVSDGQDPATYSWSQTDVQPQAGGLPSQSGNSGKFLTTDGTNASWSDKPLINSSNYATTSVGILSNAFSKVYSVCIGKNASCISDNSIVIGGASDTNYGGGTNSITIGRFSSSPAAGAISIGSKTNGSIGSGAIYIGGQSTGNYEVGAGSICLTALNSWSTNIPQGVFAVGLYPSMYTLLTSNGTIPADRLASTTGLADGNYRLRLTMASGVPTLSWVAE